MINKIFIAVFFIFIGNFVFSQDGTPVKKEKCYEEAARRKKNIKYAEWECGKRAGMVDCNEKLSYNEDNNTFLAGIDATPYNGQCETCHNNGMIERTVTFVNGKEDGIDTTTYESGCPQAIRSHIQGARSGTWVFYFDSAKVNWEINYFAGEQQGRAIFFTKRGDTTLFENYVAGKMEGIQKTYFPQSKLEKEVSYKGGLMDGYYKTYNYDGILTSHLNYKAGTKIVEVKTEVKKSPKEMQKDSLTKKYSIQKYSSTMGMKDGECKYFYDNGALLRIENWKSDIKEGEFKTFYIGGEIQNHVTYKKGLREGVYEEFYYDSKLKHKIVYKKDVVLQEYKYDQHGKETYSYGAPVKKEGEEDDEVMSGQSGKKKKKKKD